MVQMGCLNTHNCLGALGPGRTQLCASHVATLHMINWICCSIDYTVVGFHPFCYIIWYSSSALLLLCIEMSLSTILFSHSFVRYAAWLILTPLVIYLFICLMNGFNTFLDLFCFHCFGKVHLLLKQVQAFATPRQCHIHRFMISRCESSREL